MTDKKLPFSQKQMEFITESTAKINLAHGSVRSGKTVGTLFRFLQAVYECPDSQIYMIGHTASTIYDNAVRLILETDQLAMFRPFCKWYPGKRVLMFRDKTITTLGAKDSGSIGAIQGKTFSLCYCDEMTLYPENIIDMIHTRLSNPWSMMFASMNPSYPSHKIKKWIDMAEEGNSDYYQLHFTLEDNPYVEENYKKMIKNSLSGLFYKRNYLGLWCLADGAIFDFFDRDIYVVKRPPRNAEYWIAGIDVGSSNPFACILIGVSTGRFDGTGIQMWAEKEYYYDPKKRGMQKTNSEFADDIQAFLEPYCPRVIYIDPAAESFQIELKRRGLHAIHANNNVTDGIANMISLMKSGKFLVCQDCPNLIREMESYVWDPKSSEKGIDAPLKKDDHILDATRYCLHTHKATSAVLQPGYDKALGFRNSIFQ